MWSSVKVCCVIRLLEHNTILHLHLQFNGSLLKCGVTMSWIVRTFQSGVDCCKESQCSRLRKERHAKHPNTECNAARIDDLIRDSRRVTLRHISTELGTGYGVVHDIARNDLHYSQCCARWMPRMLTDDLKARRMMTSLSTVQRYAKEENGFLDCIVTGAKRGCGTLPPKETYLPRNGETAILQGLKSWKCYPLVAK
jgi:hypothetical protein